MKKFLITMLLVLSAGLSQAETNKISEPLPLPSVVEPYLPKAGGTMTGSIRWNIDYSFLDYGNLEGGMRLIDANGNAIQSGYSPLQGDIILLTTPGGASISVSDKGTGSLTVTDNGGNGVTLINGQLRFQNAGNWISIKSSGIQILSLPTYTSNETAVAGGLIQGDLYRTGGDPDVVCVVH
jgi:hypothetical protein